MSPRGKFIVYNWEGMLKPFVAVDLPYYFITGSGGGSVFGIGGSVGLQVDFLSMLGVTFEVEPQYFFVRQSNYMDFVLLGIVGIQVRF